MDNSHTSDVLLDWLRETFPGTDSDVLRGIARPGVTVVNRLVRRELREIARDLKDPGARFELYSRADRLLPHSKDT